MVQKAISGPVRIKENEVDLNSVTTATDGAGLQLDWADNINVFVEVTGNTGAVTVNIETSPTGLFAGEEVTRETQTHTATNGTFEFNFREHSPFLRTTTTTQSNSTVKTTITARS